MLLNVIFNYCLNKITMKNLLKKGFTLVELLVVITILAIISVVAYQNFWWAVDKATSWRKVNDISTIETALQQYKADNNNYPFTDVYNSSTNVWWYNSGTTANPSNIIKVTNNWAEIATVNTWSSIWWGKIYWTWSWGSSVRQIWAKWTISRETLWKKYLSKDLYDPELWDIKVWTTWSKMVDYWIWRYVYSTYKKNSIDWVWASNYNWNAYNIAYTFKKDGSDTYLTKIVWDYDNESCYEDKDKCPSNLIWLLDWSTQSWATNNTNYWIPYWITDFAQ